MKYALVTGGTRGIGSGIVESLAQAGFAVAFCGRSVSDEIREHAKELSEKYGVAIKPFECDISSDASRQRLVDDVWSEFGSIDFLVNNAGIAPKNRCDPLEMSAESFDSLINTNLKGPFFLTQAVAARMVTVKDAGFRAIINIGSVSADYISVNRGEYCISKAGVAMATKLWAARLAEYGIAAYEVRPGVIKSDMTAGVTAKYDKMIAEGLTLQPRWGYPEDVGRAVAALASGSLAYSTGQVINVDGGLTVLRF